MSTRSCIIVKINKESVGTTRKFDKSLLPSGISIERWGDRGKLKVVESPIYSGYLGVYCHCDGYPSGVGAALKIKFSNYESALNLVLIGSLSAVCVESIKPYANRVGEKWECISPIHGTLGDIESANSWAEWFYLFRDGKWYFKHWNWKNYQELTPEIISKYL